MTRTANIAGESHVGESKRGENADLVGEKLRETAANTGTKGVGAAENQRRELGTFTTPYVYVHLPFCDVICHYCDFYTVRNKNARHEDLFTALHKELTFYVDKLEPRLKSVYFGGGTPSASPPKLIHDFLNKLRDRIDANTEITVECNPHNITHENAQAWRAAGVNRLSIGIQSLDDKILKKLGRNHNSAQARTALEIATKYFTNLTGDLIYGVPDQEETAPSTHAQEMVNLGVNHFSAYHLTIEPTHFLFPKLPSGEFAWAQIKHVAQDLAKLGFHHYEISNFSRPGFESRNNQNYWHGGPYLALGPSANGFDGFNKRWKNIADWEKYMSTVAASELPIEELEVLTPEQRKIEVIFTSLRTLHGLDLAKFAAQFGFDLQQRHAGHFASWESAGLGSIQNEKFILNFEGRMLADEIAAKLIL